MHGTTVLCVRKENKAVLIADGQVTMGDHVMKHTARKTRRLYNDKVIAGFAGSTADAISLFERFEGKLQEHSGNLQKGAVELAKEWRKDRALRHLEALLIVADAKATFLLSGNGDVIEPDPRYSREARAQLTDVQDRIEAADNATDHQRYRVHRGP